VTLHEKKPIKIHEMKLMLQRIDVPTTSLLTGKQHFVTNGRQTALFDHVDKLKVECRDSASAKRFACTVPEDVCTCTDLNPKVHCHCLDNLDMAALFDGPRLLPTKLGELFFSRRAKDGVEAELLQGYYTLHLEMKDYKIAAKMDGSTCTITEPRFDDGACFRCFSGAPLRFKAKSSYGNPRAFVECGDTHFSVDDCTATGVELTRVLHFQEGSIRRNCTVQTIGGNTTFWLEGQLNSVTIEPVATRAPEILEEAPETDWGLERAKKALRNTLDWIQQHYVKMLLMAMAAAVTVGLTYLLIPLLPAIVSTIVQVALMRLKFKTS
jgi:hypothetical protein